MTIVEQVKNQLKEEIIQAVIKAELAAPEEMPDVVLETPKDKAHGDFATNMAMQLARIAKKAPRKIAEEMIASFDKQKGHIRQIDIAGPGFINFFLDNQYLTDLVPTIIKAGDAYGCSDSGQGKRVLVEFVSANPTGSLHLGHGRGAAVGDALCKLLKKAGYDAVPEYYINDGGNQITNLAVSIEVRYLQQLGQEAEIPENGYHGKDIIELAKQLVAKYGDTLAKKTEEERIRFFRNFGVDHLMRGIKKDLTDFRVHFDRWFSERSLYEEHKVEAVLDYLKGKGETYEKDGALWLKTSKYGDDKDRVLVKSDGSYTYFTPDIAYHKDKLDRGFEQLIDVLGADHHGYVPRLKAAIQTLGYNPDQLTVQIIQLVNLFKDGEKVKMSKRTGKAVTMRELMEDVGVDAARYFFAMRSSDSHLDFDLDLAISHSNENPVYYVQYAYARITSMLKRAEAFEQDDLEKLDLNLLSSEKEIDLLKKLGDFPSVVAESAQNLAIQHIPNYLFELASCLHSFYNAEKVLDETNVPLSKARVALMKAVRITLKSGMALIGVHAPEKM
ncbi:arginine--tRNA ligase [Sporolactobacillus terrae]|uniref:Arginine--tRNA ligase n=1 Tax=Sporolactobacillus terrae TaxID=269673 RepID=A0ABX5QAQ4_9BACL|nr:arginine--tRNA ligase [Sporolactobacillus terrae]QAA23675.1 arginine--tRNA ligase [Sporolactobacillus terrae]QAA26646.1 arginine--tRNA ligase [Sporolactobacillus terrae]UAK15715.1 arginine--tRNA ligase [Sporolactobacillus terrae]